MSISMKLFLFIPVILLLGFTSCKSNTYEVEDALYQCMVDKFAEKNVDLEVELKKFETHLLEEGFLANESGEAYSLLYSKMTGFPPVQITIDYDRFNSLYVVEPYELISENCMESIDSSVIKKSKVFQLEQELIKYSMNQKTTKFKSVFEVYESVIGVEEYKHPYYKSKVLLTTLYLANIEAGLPKTIPVDFKSNNSDDCNNCEKITLKLDSNGVLSHENKLINVIKVKPILREFILLNAPNYSIDLQIDKETLMRDAFEIIKLTKELISDLENEKALDIYNKPFIELDDFEKEEVKNTYPYTIQLKYN